jgi:hypothetical protein
MHVLIDGARRGKAWVQDRNRCVGDAGANLVEYALLMALVVIVCIVAVTFVGSQTCENADDARLSAFGSGGNPGSNCP